MLGTSVHGTGKSTPGAARSIDITWPGIMQVRPNNGVAVGPIGFMTRQASELPINNTSSQQFTGIGSTATWGTGTGYRGRAGIVFVCGTGAGGTGVYQTLDPMCIVPTFGDMSLQGDASGADDYACYRCQAIIAFESHSVYTSDIGIIWATAVAGGYDIQNAVVGSSGFGFCQTAADEVSFVRRSVNGGGALTKTVVRKTSVADLQKWHVYEVRVIGATATQNAKLKVLVDGALILNLDWITDNLPNPIHSNGIYGFNTVLVNHAANAGSVGQFAVNRVRFMIAQDEQSLL